MERSRQRSFSEKYPRYREILSGSSDSIVKNMRTEGLIAENRIFIGEDYDGSAGLFIYDSEGTVRIRIYVDENDVPSIDVLDSAGKRMPL